MAAHSLAFQETIFDVVDRNGQPWLKAADIARALGYKKADAVTQIYDRNSDEFTPAMCQTLSLSVSQNNGRLSREVRIFSLRGAHLLAMFARTAVAKAFRKWVLDILDKVVAGDVVVNAKTTADERSPLRAAVSMLVGKRALMYPEAYALVHQRFGVQHIDELPSARIPEAIEYVHRLALEGEWLPAASTPPECYPLSQHEAVNLSALFSCVDRMRELLQRLEPPLSQMDSRMAPAVYDGWHEVGLPLSLLGELREHADTAYRQRLLQRPACP